MSIISDRNKYLKELSDIALGSRTFLITNSKGDDIHAYPDMGDRLKALDMILKLTAPPEEQPGDEAFKIELTVIKDE